MGCGSSRNKVKNFDKGNQMPSTKSFSSPSPSKSYDPLFKPISSKPNKPQISIQTDIFELDPNVEEYSSIWDHDTKLSSTFQQSLKSDLNNIEHHQKEILNNQSSKKSSTNIDSARVESIVDTQTHSCINLSSTEKIDELINNLNRIHTDLDKIIKDRTEKISIETKSVLSNILFETQQKQQRLLNYAKEQQLKQDEQYQQLLQEYIFQLDEMKAKDLLDLQNQLQNYRNQILEESQLKLMTVNEQANRIKTKIVKDEQQQTEDKIDLIIAQIQKISADAKLQHLGSELITKTNITTNSNVGTKASGQVCIFDFEQNHSSQSRPQTNRKQIITREKEPIVTQSIKNSSAIQRSKHQQ